jgi:hypothetical protein
MTLLQIEENVKEAIQSTGLRHKVKTTNDCVSCVWFLGDVPYANAIDNVVLRSVYVLMNVVKIENYYSVTLLLARTVFQENEFRNGWQHGHVKRKEIGKFVTFCKATRGGSHLENIVADTSNNPSKDNILYTIVSMNRAITHENANGVYCTYKDAIIIADNQQQHYKTGTPERLFLFLQDFKLNESDFWILVDADSDLRIYILPSYIERIETYLYQRCVIEENLDINDVLCASNGVQEITMEHYLNRNSSDITRLVSTGMFLDVLGTKVPIKMIPNDSYKNQQLSNFKPTLKVTQDAIENYLTRLLREDVYREALLTIATQ